MGKREEIHFKILHLLVDSFQGLVTKNMLGPETLSFLSRSGPRKKKTVREERLAYGFLTTLRLGRIEVLPVSRGRFLQGLDILVLMLTTYMLQPRFLPKQNLDHGLRNLQGPKIPGPIPGASTESPSLWKASTWCFIKHQVWPELRGRPPMEGWRPHSSARSHGEDEKPEAEGL